MLAIKFGVVILQANKNCLNPYSNGMLAICAAEVSEISISV